MSKQWKYITTAEYLASREKFEKYYDENILPLLQQLEKTRKKYLYTFIIILIAVSLWLYYTGASFAEGFEKITSGEGGWKGAIGAFMVLILCWPMLSYYRRSKESLLPLIANFFGEFKYAYNEILPIGLMDSSLLFRQQGQMRGEDCFSGIYDGVSVQIMEYRRYTLEQRYNREQNIREKTYVPKERGLIFYADMNKSFEGQTIVVKDKGVFNAFTKYKNMERVGVESPDFEKKFEVYSDNQIEARYILTTVMLEYMEKLQETFSLIEFSFFHQHVLIKIETKKNTFECANFFQSIIDKKRVFKNFDEMYLLFTIITTLKLNQKRINMSIN